MTELKFAQQKLCPICGSEMIPGFQSWHTKCPQCAYEHGCLNPNINITAVHEQINEHAREVGLKELRRGNFHTLVNHIKSYKPLGGRLLEVGCAYGWFLEVARDDFEVIGLEPDKHVFNSISQNGFSVRNGYFPDAMNVDEKFDIIVFNDVIEHIPDIQCVLNSCHHFLNDEGLLVLNMPTSFGIFYKFSKIFHIIGFRHFFERMWQVEMPSPHVHYFNLKNVTFLLNSFGFKIERKGFLQSLSMRGLYKRIAFSNRQSKIMCALVWVCLALIFPILKNFPGDIMYIVASKEK